MLSNFSVQYSFGSAAVAMVIMGTTYCTSTLDECKQGNQEAWVTGTLNGITFLGAVCGQLGGGAVGDMIGRSNAFLATMSLATVGNVLSAILPSGSADSVYVSITVCRFFTGLGLGGVYPLSATKAAEDDGSEDGKTVDPRGAAFAFFWQMPGIAGPWVLGLLTAHSPIDVEAKWRLLLGFGAVFTGLATLCLIMERRVLQAEREMVITASKMSDMRGSSANAAAPKSTVAGLDVTALATESPGSTDEGSDVGPNPNKPAGVGTNTAPGANTGRDSNNTTISSLTDSYIEDGGKKSFNDADGERPSVWGWVANPDDNASVSMMTTLKSEYASDPDFIAKFIVTGVCWFLFDIVVFGIQLFLPQIIHSITPHFDDISSPAAMQSTFGKAVGVQSLAIPATCLVVLALPYVSLAKIQSYGFFVLGCGCLLFMIGYASYGDNSPNTIFVMFCVLGFTMQCGVNVTTFVLPSAVFRKEVRSTCNGVAAALGKSGAFVGAYLFPLVMHSSKDWVVIVLGTCFAICILGSLLTCMYCSDHIINDYNEAKKTENLGSLQSNQPSFAENYPAPPLNLGLGQHGVVGDKKNVEMRGRLGSSSSKSIGAAAANGTTPFPSSIDENEIEDGKVKDRKAGVSAATAIVAPEPVANPMVNS